METSTSTNESTVTSSNKEKQIFSNADIHKIVPLGEKSEAWASFNKITGVFCGISQKVDIKKLNHEFFDYRAVNIDIGSEEIIGTLDDFKIVKISEQPQPIYETSLDNAMYAKMDRVCKVYKRLEIIEKACLNLSKTLNVPNEDLEELCSLISEIRHVNELTKKDFETDTEFNYISIQQELEDFDAEMEGGLHEFAGIRQPVPAILDQPVIDYGASKY
jgi:hypothetical protein